MPEARQKGRRLTAVMFTDAVGYTGLTERDESRARQVRERHRRLAGARFQMIDGRDPIYPLEKYREATGQLLAFPAEEPGSRVPTRQSVGKCPGP